MNSFEMYLQERAGEDFTQAGIDPDYWCDHFEEWLAEREAEELNEMADKWRQEEMNRFAKEVERYLEKATEEKYEAIRKLDALDRQLAWIIAVFSFLMLGFAVFSYIYF